MLTQINDNKDTKLVLAGEVPILLGIPYEVTICTLHQSRCSSQTDQYRISLFFRYRLKGFAMCKKNFSIPTCSACVFVAITFVIPLVTAIAVFKYHEVKFGDSQTFINEPDGALLLHLGP
jgi:hypothetical protein